eukprot:SRR837773.1869.p1 GENE.SRR837773.1869~~SRR837773.1869.p1  ORF type:complete len:453 (-),score=105.07 SRR837773.1869:16-1353(-)
MDAWREQRMRRLVEYLLSPAAQPKELEELPEQDPLLSDDEVRHLFVQHVPGVEEFVFRGQHNNFSLKFIVSAYKTGLRALSGSVVGLHLVWCLRFVVHQAHDGRPGAARQLVELAEGFKDCQAVQARAIERAALQLRQAAPDFPGLLLRHVGEYKAVALKMLTADRLAKGLAMDHDAVPTHYENRLTADVGPLIGANPEEIRLASMDEHATHRFEALAGQAAEEAAARCRELFDCQAMLRSFAAEVNTFGAESHEASMARTFLHWVDENFSSEHKHLVFDEETVTRTAVEDDLSLCVFERVFLGEVFAAPDEQIRGVPLVAIFAEAVPEETSLRAAAATAAPAEVPSRMRMRKRPLRSPRPEARAPETAPPEEHLGTPLLAAEAGPEADEATSNDAVSAADSSEATGTSVRLLRAAVRVGCTRRCARGKRPARQGHASMIVAANR